MADRPHGTLVGTLRFGLKRAHNPSRELDITLSGIGTSSGAQVRNNARPGARHSRPDVPGDDTCAARSIERLVPDYDFIERHHIDINAAPHDCYAASRHLDFSDSRTIRWLFTVRRLHDKELSIDAMIAGGRKIAWNFETQPLANGRTRLHTEARVACSDRLTRIAFPPTG